MVTQNLKELVLRIATSISDQDNDLDLFCAKLVEAWDGNEFDEVTRMLSYSLISDPGFNLIRKYITSDQLQELLADPNTRKEIRSKWR